MADLAASGILANAIVPAYSSANASHVQSVLANRRLRETLGTRLGRRPSLTDMEKLGYLHELSLVPRSNADALDKFLRERPDLDYLKRKHIITQTSNLACIMHRDKTNNFFCELKH